MAVNKRKEQLQKLSFDDLVKSFERALKQALRPDQVPVWAEPRARGYAIEDMRLDALRFRYKATRNWFKTIDGIAGEPVVKIENGEPIFEYVNPDGLSIKSTQITDPQGLAEKITTDMNALANFSEYQVGNMRVKGLNRRRLELIFEEGTAGKIDNRLYDLLEGF